MILGTMKQGMEFSMYGNADETACVPIEGADLSEQLEKAVSNLKLTNAIRKRTQETEKEAGVIPLSKMSAISPLPRLTERCISVKTTS